MAITTTGGLNPDAQNQVITQWASMVQSRMRNSTSSFINGKEGTITRPGRTEKKLSSSIRTQSRKTYGIITGQSFIFERHGVFVHKGVGRGYQMQGGMVVRTAKSAIPDPQKREPVEWFNPVILQSLPELADKLAEINADAIVNATRMMIR